MKVLIVDDSSTMRRIISNTITSLGYPDVLQAADIEVIDLRQTRPRMEEAFISLVRRQMQAEDTIDGSD